MIHTSGTWPMNERLGSDTRHIMTNLIHPTLICGGSGTRLWPLSRKSHPKQFAKLMGEESLFQSAARRLSGQGFAPPLVVTGPDFRFTVVEQLATLEIAPSQILIEPSARNTAAAICAAVVALDAESGDSLMLVAPSDHVMTDAEGFRETVKAAVSTARLGQIVTFGIRPDRVEAGYGWLELPARISRGFPATPQPLNSFVEKPSAEAAESLLVGGMHLWNAGIFLFSTATILDAFANHAPEILDQVRKAHGAAETDLGFTRLAVEPWSKLEDISIDYAVMERAPNLSVMPYDGPWSDLGDWQAMWREGKADCNGVVASGQATALDCRDTLLLRD